MTGETAAVSCLVVVLVRLPTQPSLVVQVQGWIENDSEDDEESDEESDDAD